MVVAGPYGSVMRSSRSPRPTNAVGAGSVRRRTTVRGMQAL